MGASGSSTINTYDCVPAGAPCQLSAGEIFSPLHVYCLGIDAWCKNVGLSSDKLMAILLMVIVQKITTNNKKLTTNIIPL